MSGNDKHFCKALNWHIYAEQKISVVNETKRYKIWLKPNILCKKTFEIYRQISFKFVNYSKKKFYYAGTQSVFWNVNFWN